MPSSRWVVPKAKRTVPVCRSMPMIEIITPTTAAIRPLTSDLSESDTTAVRPSTIRAKYSVGPKATATRESSGATSIRKTMEMVPPMKEA